MSVIHGVDSSTGEPTILKATSNALQVIQASGGVSPSLTYKGQARSTTTGATENLTIPAGSTRVILSCGPSTQAYVNINAAATTSSPLYFEDPFGPLIFDLGSVTQIAVYCVAGNVGAVFFG